MLDQFCKVLRLSEKESKIAKAMCSLGTVRASTLANACELPRNTVRGILDTLVTKGVVFKTRRRNAQYYGLQSKENLIKALRQQKDLVELDFDQRIDAIEDLGDLFSSQETQRAQPKVTFYDGHEGIKRVYEDTLSAKSGLRSWGVFDANSEALPQYFNNYYKRRAKRKISMTSIHPDTELARIHQRNDAKELRNSVLVPADKYYWHPEIQVYDDKVNIVSWKDKLGIIVESKEIANAFKAIFDLSFDCAKQIFAPRKKRK